MTKWVVPVISAGAITAVAAAFAFTGTATQQEPSTEAPPGFVAPANVDTAGLPGPIQPIFFRHDVHAGQYRIDCKYCHSYVEVSPVPGIPTLSACMGCHRVVGAGNPEVKKLTDAFAANKAIDWVKVHNLPPFVHFPHMMHVVKGELACQTCHGEVQLMPREYQYASLKMGWCVTCHRQRGVTTDCTACHY
jgi:Cytochrome c7 and related cytochrome c